MQLSKKKPTKVSFDWKNHPKRKFESKSPVSLSKALEPPPHSPSMRMIRSKHQLNYCRVNLIKAMTTSKPCTNQLKITVLFNHSMNHYTHKDRVTSPNNMRSTSIKRRKSLQDFMSFLIHVVYAPYIQYSIINSWVKIHLHGLFFILSHVRSSCDFM